ncbi:MAG: leucyl/phenylalanyl-tRNA--protein transferase [Deltaproteobacteria bacterium]|nr:leucyl/phenylalanyl-tRNA--protein transferase [Deltaproteobacteria bacterium]
MTVYRLGSEVAFPPPEEAEASGLLAVGGDLQPERLLLAYSLGIFPWPLVARPLLWFSPDPRMVLEPARLRVSRSLAKTLRSARFEVRLDTCFDEVVRHCAEVRRRDDAGTWITPELAAAYRRLHRLGFAHSAEAWQDGRLAGGLYGVSLGGAFFGESMFTRRPDASKVAFATLVRQLAAWGFDLVDCQVHTDHLARFGAVEWPRARFLAALAATLARPPRRGAWRLDVQPGPCDPSDTVP